uniref:Reverse transcriptase domain-containing protein n=1 Tax=Knipowitschia caucasica TaxID=637954 RepID=A0AAV2KKU9_KNICA
MLRRYSVKLIKFADDTTLIGLISNNDESYRREVDRLVSWCSGNNLELNAQKTVEMIVDFRKSTVPPPPPSVMDSPITSVESFRFLGTTITQDLKWEPTISSLIKKAQQRMYFLRQLRKAKLPAQMLVQFYTAIIESILTSSITSYISSSITSSITSSICEPIHLDTAKYGSYTMMNLKANRVIDIQLVQSNEVGNSVRMEKEGFVRSLTMLEERGVEVQAIVTDRHSGVQKFLREQRPDISHYFDPWHMGKGIGKKMEELGKKRGTEDCLVIVPDSAAVSDFTTCSSMASITSAAAGERPAAEEEPAAEDGPGAENGPEAEDGPEAENGPGAEDGPGAENGPEAEDGPALGSVSELDSVSASSVIK